MAFESVATNLISGDGNGVSDVFVRDRVNGTTERMSGQTSGVQTDGGSWAPSISLDGRYVAFHTKAANPPPGEHRYPEVVARDRRTGTMIRISVPVSGTSPNNRSIAADVSANGWYEVFQSLASNLVSSDTNGTEDVFLRGPVGAVPASLIDQEWTKIPTSDRVVALTFDAGGNAAGLASILSTLRSTGTPATFFLTGRWAEVYPTQAADIGASFAVGNHSYSHPDLTGLSDAAVRDEINRAQDVIAAKTGWDARPIFRFPFGARDSRTIDIVNSEQYGPIGWTVDTLGWMGTSGGQSEETVIKRVLDALQPGEIVIMHVGSNPDDGSTLDADALPEVIAEITARGYRFVTIIDYT